MVVCAGQEFPFWIRKVSFFDKIRTCGALEVTSPFVKLGENNFPTIGDGKTGVTV